MGNGNTVSIVVTAQTAQAVQQLQQVPAAVNNVKQSVAGIGQAAAQAGEHVRGMAYYFRSGIDSIRFALAGGGERAGFYAVDEAIRGLISSGMKLSTLVPVIGGITAAVGAVVLGIHEWNSGVEEQIKHAKDLQDAWKEIPKTIQQISDMQQAGLLSPQAAANFADIATGRKKLYVDAAGNVTTSPGQNVTMPGGNSFGMSPYSSGPTSQFVPYREATYQEGAKYLQDQLTGGGEFAKEQLDALNEAHSELQKFNEESLSGIEKQKQEVIDRYAEERKQMQITLNELQALMDATTFAHSKQAMDLKAALDSIPARQAAEIAGLNAKESGSPEVTVKDMGQELKAAWDAIEDEISAKAAAAGKQREAYYQEEFGLRMGLSTEMYTSGLLTWQQYSDAVREGTAQMLADQKKMNDEVKRELDLRQQIARGETEGRLRAVNGNPFLTDDQKAEQSVPLYQQLMGQNAATISGLARTAATTSDEGASLEAQKQMVDLMGQQYELQSKINELSEEGSWSYEVAMMVKHFTDLKSLAQQTTEIFSGTLNTAINSVASNMTRVIMGTESWRKAVLNVEEAILGNLIQAIIKAAEQWVVSEIMKYTLGQVLQQAAVAASAATATEESLVWWTPAVLSTIASAGTTAADAAGLVGAAILGFAEGGRPEPGRIALVGERGPELWVPDSAGTVIPSDKTAAMMAQGRGSAGGYSSGSRGSNVNLHFYDERPHPREYLNSPEGENHVVNITRKNRTKIGIQT